MMDSKLKQRLVGATVLIVLAVIFLPKLLDGGNKSTTTEIKLPPESGAEFTSKVIPLDDPAQMSAPASSLSETSPIVEASPSIPAAAATVKEVSKPNVPAPVTETKTETTPPVSAAPKPAEPAEVKTDVSKVASTEPTWVVQLATVSNEQGALKLRDKLRSKGYTAFVEPLAGATGKTFRVRVGPQLDRAASEAMRDKLEKDVKIKGIVVRYSS